MNTSGINSNISWKRMMAAAETARMRNPSLKRAENTVRTASGERTKPGAPGSGLKKAERSYAGKRPSSEKASLGKRFDAYA